MPQAGLRGSSGRARVSGDAYRSPSHHFAAGFAALERAVVTRRSGRSGEAPGRYGFASVAKDPLDLRDLTYQGSLAELPRSIDNRHRVPYTLDQATEGACTGFAMAAVVNFLIHNHSGWPELEDSVSPRMLYQLALRYDEWEGESSEGSSIRGAMKGWKRHGVCSWELWPYDPENAGELSRAAAIDALSRPMGSYFRVRHRHLDHMHAALNEAGILLASALVHPGWDRVPARGKPSIAFESDGIGGHAFAIVGYDDAGFWIQNSWGDSWGRGGFAHLSYPDWLQNGWDCWVARLGVPVTALASRELSGTSAGTAAIDRLGDEAPMLHAISGHYVRVGNDGGLGGRGRLATDRGDVEAIFRERAPAFGRRQDGPLRILLYAHGGLNHEAASARRIARLAPHFLENGIYPLHFMWKTGAVETVTNILREAFWDRRMRGWRDDARESLSDLFDAAMELAARGLGRALWSEIKENARLASESDDGGARLVAAELAALTRRSPALEVHLAAHSGGSIFHAHLVRELLRRGVGIQSLTFLAPSCSMSLFDSHLRPHLSPSSPGEASEISSFALMNLTDRAEREDAVGPYRKSLLYLVSRAFEARRKTPLLGMQSFVDRDRSLRRLLGRPAVSDGTAISRAGIPASRRLESSSRRHAGFDEDDATLNSLLRIVLRTNQPKRPFGAT